MSHALSPWVHSNFSDRTWDIQVIVVTTFDRVRPLSLGGTAYTLPTPAIADAS
ncbi:hypothetical protein IQ273_27525 [Nodosilinea sp. LEGE 07298]|uniref:hypothetical protein n=1 Tax=Nodosilinea sp. LEGE 07298 TaxID=2777970 RepID=UPI001881EFE2|nr:hypothetical protein [Nodosilinea sp. LEGE 07298]MBE9113136.1 hypothetical protein [Nodosilinea sp. LEGE 07298]